MIPAELTGVNFKDLQFNFTNIELLERFSHVRDMRCVKYTIKKQLTKSSKNTYFERSLYDMFLKLRSISVIESGYVLTNIYIVKFEDDQGNVLTQKFNYGDYIFLQNTDEKQPTERCLHSIW